MRRWLKMLLLVWGLAGCSGGGGAGAPASPVAPALTPGTGVIRAGKGVDAVSLGQVRSEVEKALGQPSETDRNEFNQAQSYALYHEKGLEIAYDGERVAMIVCHADSPWTPYTGRTEQGLWVGSSKAEVIQALGQPREDPGQALDYGALGLWFTFDKEGRVETIKILPPK